MRLRNFATLQPAIDQIVQLGAPWGARAPNVMDSIEQSKHRPLWRLIAAFGIRNVGGQSAQILADEFGSLDALMKADPDTLESIDQIGPVMAQSIYEYFHDPENLKVIQQLIDAGVKPAPPKAKASSALDGMTVVVTGTLEHFTRQEIEQTIKQHGGKTASSVSKKTSFVLAGDNSGSKLDKARQLGVEVIDEAEFLKRIGERRSHLF